MFTSNSEIKWSHSPIGLNENLKSFSWTASSINVKYPSYDLLIIWNISFKCQPDRTHGLAPIIIYYLESGFRDINDIKIATSLYNYIIMFAEAYLMMSWHWRVPFLVLLVSLHFTSSLRLTEWHAISLSSTTWFILIKPIRVKTAGHS